MLFGISFNVLVYLIIDTLIYIISESFTVGLFIDFLDIDWTFLIIGNQACFHMKHQTL